MSDPLDDRLRRATPPAPNTTQDGDVHQHLALLSAEARRTAVDDRRARRRHRAVAVTAGLALVSAGTVGAAASGGMSLFGVLEERPDARTTLTFPSGKVCDVRYAVAPEEGEVRADDDATVQAGAQILQDLDLDELDLSAGLAEYARPEWQEVEAPLTADQQYEFALQDTVAAEVRAQLRAQGITEPISLMGLTQNCTDESPQTP